MHECSKDILCLLKEGLKLFPAKDTFVNREPVAPAVCVTIYDTGGAQPESTLSSDGSYHRDTFQVRVRHTDYDAGMELAYKIYFFLHELHQTVVNNIYYGSILATTVPFVLNWDEQGRVIIVINFETERRKK